jgi:hypothetical protein
MRKAFAVTLGITHRLTDGLVFADGVKGEPLFAEPGLRGVFAWTVTGV